MTRANLLLVAVATCAALAFSLQPRLAEHQRYQASPERHFGAGVPAATADAYYWLRMARLAADGAVPERDTLRRYPDGVSPVEVPALSRLIAAVATLTGTEVYAAGLWVSVALSSLFVLPLMLTCWQLSLPAAGVLGALLGSFSPAFFYRSSVGDVDTDGGNLFFVWSLAACLVAIRPDAPATRRGLATGLGGLALWGFVWWYGHSAFWLVFAATFALHLVCVGFPRREGLSLLLLFVLCSNPLHALDAAQGLLELAGTFVFTEAATSRGALVFPNPLAGIEELKRLPPLRTLEGLTRNAGLSAAGLVCFLLLGARRWRRLVPLLPIALFGALGLLRAFRFAMYLAPLVGIGLGAALGFGLRRALGAQRDAPWVPWLETAGAFAAVAAAAAPSPPITPEHPSSPRPHSWPAWRPCATSTRRAPRCWRPGPWATW